MPESACTKPRQPSAKKKTEPLVLVPSATAAELGAAAGVAAAYSQR